MRKIAAFPLLLLLLFEVGVAQLSPRLDSLKVYALDKCMLSTTTNLVTDSRIVRAINESIVQVCADFNAVEKFDTVAIHKSMEGATLNTDFLRVKEVYKKFGDTLRLAMQPFNGNDVWSVTGGVTDNAHIHDRSDDVEPRYYGTFGNKIITYPKDAKESSAPDSLVVVYWGAGRAIWATTDTTDIMVGYRAILIEQAAMRLSLLRGDYAMAAMLNARYEAEVSRRGWMAK